MSSSFVKDCSDVSALGNTSSGKTVIIIVNNETGNVSLDGNELQNLLASHGADGSQVSVVRMGSGAAVNLSETVASTITTVADGAQHVNLTVEGFPSIPVEGQVGGTGSYAELPLDADAFRRLESVLESEEAQEILGKPLLDMVANPEQLGPLDELMDSSLFEGESQSAVPSGYTVSSSGTTMRKIQSAPKRRSQRQMDKAEREEVEKILAENHKKMQEEREQLDGQQIVVPFGPGVAPTLLSVQGECQDGVVMAEECVVMKDGEEYEMEGSKVKGNDSAPTRGKGRGRGRGRGRGKGDIERIGAQEVKGRARGKKNMDGDIEKGEEGGRGKPRGRGRGRPISVVTTTATVPVHDIYEQVIENAGAVLKKCKVIVRKKKSTDFFLNEIKELAPLEGYNEGDSIPADTADTEPVVDTMEQAVSGAKKVVKKAPVTPKVMPQFEPALFSTPDVMHKVGESIPTQAIMVKGNGKNIKAQKILLVKKQVRKEKPQPGVQPVNEEESVQLRISEDQEQQEATAVDVNNLEELITGQDEIAGEEEETKPSTTIRESGILSSVTKVVKKRVTAGEGKSKVIQVNCPTEVRQVVVLNSARAGMNKETLVKIIPPKDPPKEEEKTSQGKQKMTKKEGKQQVKKSSPTAPATKPTGPATKPIAPATKPTAPATKPTAPATKPTGPATKPTAPATKPAAPATKPAALATKPAALATKPAALATKPAALATKPAALATKPAALATKPAALATKPTALATKPAAPITKPAAPVTKPAAPATKPTAPAPATQEGEQGKASPMKETVKKEPQKKLMKKMKPDVQKGGDLHKSFEDIVLLRKREEAQRKKEEIQRRREEILRKREAIKKRKELKEMELKGIMVKRETEINSPQKEPPMPPKKMVKFPNKGVMVKREPEDGKKNVIQVTTAAGGKPAPSIPTMTTIKVIRRVVPHTALSFQDESPIRRSNRAIKKKKFGDEMLTYDLKEELAPDVKEEEVVEEEMIITQEEEEEDESMEEDGEDDDPEKLWCICQKPHNNRFMICCDRCEDWFHGTCVGVTKAIGQQMEEEGREWVCPKCKKTERAIKGVVVLGKKRIEGPLITLNSPVIKLEPPQLSPIKTIKRIIINKPDETEDHGEVKKPAEVKKVPEGGRRLGGLSGFTIPKKVNVVHEAIVPPKKILSDEKKVTSSPQVIKLSQKKVSEGGREVQETARGVGSLEKTKPKVLVYQKSTGRIISGSEAPTFDELKDWLREHPDCGILQPGMMNASGTLVNQSAIVPSTPNSQKRIIQVAKSTAIPVSSSTPQKVTVVKSSDGRVIVKTSENVEKETPTKVVNTVTSQPTPKTVIVSTAKTTASSAKEVEEKKDGSPAKKEEAPVKTPTKESKKTVKIPSSEKKKTDNIEVRSSVKKMLVEGLTKRYEETKDEFPNVTDEYIKNLVYDIEKELYLHFGKDVGMKYKTRYRSILFNTKDSKNTGLFRKILKGTISPSQLAKMTSEELASKELLEWREREEKKELQAIEKHELEMIALGNQYIMKSHKGEIEIDKDEFIKEKEKAPDTLNALPIDPMTEILDDSTANHNSHIYDLNCKICNGQEEQPAVVRQDSKSHKEKSKDKLNKESKDRRIEEPAKVKDRKSSSDKDRKERRDSSDKERHRHRSKDHKDKNRDKHKSKHSDDSKDKPRDRERHKSSSSFSNDKDKDKDRDKEKERRDSRDRREDKDKKRRDKHRDRRDSKDEKSSNKRRDSEKDDRKDDWKRRHSGSRSDNRKRRESEKENARHRDSGSCEKQKDEVSTSDDVVFDVGGTERSSSSSSLPDGYMRDAEPSSTVIGSPEETNLRDSVSPTPEDNSTPPLPPASPYSVLPSPAEAYSPSSPLNSEISSPQPPHDRDTLTPPPLPDDEMPSAPPLPDYDVPCTPPPPDEYSPQTPPMPGALSAFKEPLVDGFTMSHLSPPPTGRSTTPPLPEPSSTPPLPTTNLLRPDSPATPPLPASGGSTPTQTGASSTPPQTPRGSTPPLPKEKSSGPDTHSGVPGYMPASPTLLDYNKNLGRLTPPFGAESPTVSSKASTPVLITPEPENVWQGIIHMPDVAKFSASAFEVSGKAKFLPNDVPNMIEVVGRIAPDMVWSYIAQMKKSGSKEILVVRFQPADEEEKVSYIALYSYLSSKKRYAVIGNCGKSVKDFYIVPLASHQTIPQVLLPLNGPGFEEQRAHMLIGVIVRAKSKRVFDHTTGNWKVVSGGQTLASHKISDLDRSCTPPLPTDEDIQEIALAAKEAEDFDLDNDLLGYRDSRSLKRRARDPGESSHAKKRLVALKDQSSDSSSSLIGEEPNSPPEESYVEASLDQESMLAELNRQIEEHKKELSEMQKTIGNDEDEPYSPSHADDSPSHEGEQLKLDTSKINIPSNLQEILDNIREKEAEIKQKEQEIKRRLSLTSDPIVMNYGKYQPDKKKEKEGTSSGKDVDLRPLLQTKSNKETKTDTDLRVLKATTEESKSNKVEAATKTEEDVDLRIRDPRLARAQASAATAAAPATECPEKGKTLSKMTDEELLAKALEMEDTESNSRQAHPEAGVESQFHPVIPVPPPFIPPGIPGGFIASGGPIMGPDPLASPMPPPMPPVPPPYMGSVALPSVDIYGPQSSRLSGPHGPPGYGGHVPPGPDPGSSGYSGPLGPSRQRYSGQAWEGGQDYSERGWSHGYQDWDRDWDRDWDWDWDRDRDWDRGRERNRDREMHPSRDPGHSRHQYKGKRHDRKGGGRERSRESKYEKHDKEKDIPKEGEGSEDDGPYSEIDY